MTRIEVKPLTRELFRAFHGEDPKYSIKGFAWLEDGEVFAVCCISQTLAETLLLFDANRDLSDFRMRRVVLQGWQTVKTLFHGTVYSVVDGDKPTAERLHRHLGFEPWEDDIYIYRGA